jgi:hypothetical protein
MRVKYQTANGRLTFEFESENDKKLFATLAHIQEIFEEAACGCCKSNRIIYDVREFDGNSYYKLLCEACGATLDFGQHKTGDSLFPKRFDKDAKAELPNGGWYRYKETQAKPQAAPSANHVTPGPTTPVPTRAATPPPANRPAPKEPTTSELLANALATLPTLRHLHKVEEWGRWWKGIPNRTHAMNDQFEEAYHAAMERIAGRS